MKPSHFVHSAMALALLSAFPMHATAQDSGSGNAAGLGVVYVTAQQRQQRLQDVPVSVTAISGDFVESNHLKDFSDLAKFTPGFTSGSNYGFIRNSSMRGISNNQFGFADDPSIAIFVDNVYQGRGGTGSQVNSLYDLKRAEIVKGPQATLFGRSSIGGAISLVTNEPTSKLEGDAMLGLGERSRQIARGTINVPLAPGFAVRLALNSEGQDGYIANTNGGPALQPLDVKAARLQARYFTSGGVDVNIKLGKETRKQGGAIYQVDGLPDFTSNQTLKGSDSYSNFDIQDAVADIKFNLSRSLTLQSITSQRNVTNRYAEDYDGIAPVVAGPYSQGTEDKLSQQDFRLTFSGKDKFTIIAGASFFKEQMSGFVSNNVDGNSSFTGFAFTAKPTPGLSPNNFANSFYEYGKLAGDFSGQSIYADVTWPLTPVWTVTGGVRQNRDSKRYTQDIPDPMGLPENAGKIFAGAYYNWGYFTGRPITSEKSWDNTSYRAALSYEFNKDTTSYLQWSQGWKAGGIDTFKVSAPPSFNQFFGLDAAAVGATPNVYNPETSTSLELGLKGRAHDNKLIYALALYRFKYKDLQVSVPQGGSSIIANVGEAVGTGFEGELRMRPVEQWDLFANLSVNDTRIESFPQRPDQVGLPLNQAPKVIAAAGATYYLRSTALPGEVSLGANVSHRGAYRNDNQLTEGVDPATLLNLRTAWESTSGKYSAALYVDNVLDTFTFSRRNLPSANPFSFPVASRSVLGERRTVGIDLRMRF